MDWASPEPRSWHRELPLQTENRRPGLVSSPDARVLPVFPLALALAAEAAHQTGPPWLALSLSHPVWRLALALSPETTSLAARPGADSPLS